MLLCNLGSLYVVTTGTSSSRPYSVTRPKAHNMVLSLDDTRQLVRG